MRPIRMNSYDCTPVIESNAMCPIRIYDGCCTSIANSDRMGSVRIYHYSLRFEKAEGGEKKDCEIYYFFHGVILRLKSPDWISYVSQKPIQKVIKNRSIPIDPSELLAQRYLRG